MVFQFVRSVWSPAGKDNDNSCGKSNPDNRFALPVVGDCSRPDARFCSAAGSELIRWDNCDPIFDADTLPACVTAADCNAVPAVLVVCGGSVKAVSCEEVAPAAASPA